MCFSATASFCSSALLAALGGMTLKNCSTKKELFIASWPCFFGLQQFSEGLQWLSLQNELQTNYIPTIAFYFYLFFALVFWPIWIPLSLQMVEKNPTVKKIITLILALGIGLALYYVLTLQYSHPSLYILHNRLTYDSDINSMKYLYSLIILLPFFLSSYKGMKYFGFVTMISFIIAVYFYAYAFLSVWCFFAALISLMLYKIVKLNQKDKDINAEPNVVVHK